MELTPPEVRLAHNGDVEIAHLDWGRPAGPGPALPLLLVPGLGGGRLAYPVGFVQALADAGFHVATYDPRDVGASTRFTTTTPPSPWRALLGAGAPAYTAEDLADDAVAVLDALGWARAHLFGMSNGGLVAQRIALRHPDRVSGLVTMSAMPSDAGPVTGLRHLHLDFVRRTAALDHPDTREGDIETAVDVARLCASPAHPFDEAALRAGLAATPVEGVRDAGAQSRHLRAPWRGPRLRELRTPTLVVHGDHDPVVRLGAARAIARAVPEAQLEVLPGHAHDLPEPLWDVLARRMRRNADRTTTASADLRRRAAGATTSAGAPPAGAGRTPTTRGAQNGGRAG